MKYYLRTVFSRLGNSGTKITFYHEILGPRVLFAFHFLIFIGFIIHSIGLLSDIALVRIFSRERFPFLGYFYNNGGDFDFEEVNYSLS